MEISVNLYQTARRDISEDSIIYSQDHKNRKSHCPLILRFMFERIIKIIFSIKRIKLSFLDAFEKLQKVTISFVVMSVCLSVHPHGTTGLPLDGFS